VGDLRDCLQLSRQVGDLQPASLSEQESLKYLDRSGRAAEVGRAQNLILTLIRSVHLGKVFCPSELQFPQM
jgi:hypothetical protein